MASIHALHYAMMFPNDTSLVEEGGADVDVAERDGAEWEGGAAESDYRDLYCTSLRLMVAVSMAHMTEKWSKKGKGTEKWHKICVIAEGKMSLLWIVVSLYTSIMERMKCVGKSIMRCSNKERKNRVRGSMIEL